VDKKILIVADDPEVRDLMALALSGNGFRSLAVPDGGAILQFGLIQPDLVILDIAPTGKDRWRTLQRIRELSSVPLIALIDPDDYVGTSESLDRGADFSLAKPFDVQELQARVRALLRRVQYAARSARQSHTVPLYGGNAC
jgi:two-component system OmpR family response regulator